MLEQHREHVWLDLAKLQEAGLYLNLFQCKSEKQKISFVSIIVTQAVVKFKMELDKVQTIAEWPEHASHCNIQVFFGLANLYRRFISSFWCLPKPMTNMLRSGKNGHVLGPFIPTPAMKQSFADLCDAFTKALVLAHYHSVKLICFEMDASSFAIASIISQQQDNVCKGGDGTVHAWKLF